MADLVVTIPANKSEVGVPHPEKAEIHPFLPENPSVNYVGKLVYLNANKRADLANAGAAGTVNTLLGLCTSQISRGISVMKRGFVGSDVDVTGMTPGAQVYASNTAGAMADAAGTVSKTVGRAIPASDAQYGPDATLLLYIDVTWS